MGDSMNTLRALVRPTVTWGLVGAFLAAAFFDKAAVEVIAGPMGIALGFWFKDREAA